MSTTSTDPRPSSDYGLAPLTSPVDPQLDVVLVHGLDGSRCETWTNANGKLWPVWLGEMVPTARIWTYGYKSAVWKKPSQDTLDVHCATFLRNCRTEGIGSSDNVKVVFVGHSLGGILIKAVRTSEY
jgi:predicted alpha/beta-fold hydrolase